MLNRAWWGTVALACAATWVVSSSRLGAIQATADVGADGGIIQGVVTGTKGREAGVWVIAETRDLPTKLIKIVVTDDRGRYLLPELPWATYTLWVRGYGWVDGPKVDGRPGSTVNLTATIAPSPKAAAEYDPANYWFALLHPPPASDFPGTGNTSYSSSRRERKHSRAKESP